MTSRPGTPGYRPGLSEKIKDAVIRPARSKLGQKVGKSERIEAGNVVWVFGSGRTGSTWLSAMMDDMKNQKVWREPLVGALFGNFYYVRAGHRIDKRGEHFILGSAYKDVWLKPIRDIVLDGATARFPEAVDGYLVVKEPNGSIGAPLIMEALPESRMVLLIRDPRDVVASSMDARREGSWLQEKRSADARGKNAPARALPDSNPNVYVRKRAKAFMEQAGNARQAYEAHKGRKSLVRYEDLRADTAGTMKRMYRDLGITVDEVELARVIEEHAWENIPQEQKGAGKFYRKATPGGWREDLTPRQIEIVEEITAPLLKAFYS